MATSLATRLLLRLDTTLNATSGLGTYNLTQNQQLEDQLANGTAVDQADLEYDNSYTILTGADQDIDLAGVLTNPLGGAVTFARIKAIYIELTTTTAGYYITVGGGSNPFLTWLGAGGDLVKVRGGGVFLLYAPDATAYAVTAGTGDILRISNPNAGSVTVKVKLVGASA